MSRVRTALSAAAALAALALTASPAGAATILDVEWGEGCGPTNCFVKGRYTHTWSAANASGPISIGQLLLDRSILGDLDGQVFRLSFQLNGEEVGSWGRYMMANVAGDELSFFGDELTWNPEDGDLVLVLEITPLHLGFGGDDGVGWSYGLASSPSGGGLPGDGGQQLPQEGGGGLPGPGSETGAVAAVPEPATWALMIGGFGLAGAALRRRRAVPQMQPIG